MNTETSIPESKKLLRQSVLVRLKATSAEQRSAWSSAIVQWLTVSDSWVGHGGTVALFGGLKLEPDLLSLIPWLRARGMKAALFAIEAERGLVPYLVNREEDLVSGQLGVWEPKRETEMRVGIEEIGTVLVPGRAFSPVDGARLGLGKGHYDRVLSSSLFRARKIAVAFGAQLEPSVPCEPHDMRIDAIVTENGWMGIGRADLVAPIDPAPDPLSKYLRQLFV